MMAFGRRKNKHEKGHGSDAVPAVDDVAVAAVEEVVETDIDVVEYDGGPYDIEDFDNPDEAVLARLDLGSVLIPMPPGGQVQVEFNQTGVPSAIWVVTPNGRFTIAAYAAPKSPGLWREVAAELAEALRNDNATVSIEDGPWGREVVGLGAGAVRFIGVDGYRWMIRCVVNGMPQSMPALVAEAWEALADTVIRRGETPLPVRSPLPVQLPEELAAQLRAAAAQQAQQMQAQQAMLAAQQAAMAAQQAQQQPEGGAVVEQVRTTSTGG
ncbi:MAG: DUF3710 domain-containing protein [Mycobacterium sp.]